MNENPSHPMMNTRYDFEREDAEGRGQCDLQGSLECAAAQECHRFVGMVIQSSFV